MQLVAAANPTFLDNMRQLWRRDIRLAQQIDELPLDTGPKPQPSKKGPPTASVQAPDGRTLYLHSRYDPEREAADLIGSLDADDSACVILCGLGLGYVARAIFNRFGRETIVLVGEPDLTIIRAALESADFSREIGDGRIEFLPSADTAYLHERLRGHWASLMMGTRFVAPAVSRELHGEFHAEFRKAMTDFAAYARMSVMTLVKNAAVTCRNIANNLPTLAATPPIDVLRRRFAGYPAVLVAAGPSLQKNIDRLRELQNRAVIIAAQTTLRPLLERGIRPHFVTSLDFNEMSKHFFEGIDIPEDVVLVAEPKATWHVIDTYRGTTAGLNRRVTLLDNPFVTRCLGSAAGKRSSLEAGATVMHLAFYLAEWLGCDPIMLVGQDLAFTGHCYYAPGMAIHRAWAPELGRYATLEMKEWERIARQKNIRRKVVDVEGRSIYTDEQMFTYLQQFERDFARSPARVIDATEGGARKGHTTAMTLEDAALQFCDREIDPRCFEYLDARWWDESRLVSLRDALALRFDELKQFRAHCVETRGLLIELKGLTSSPKEFNRRLVRVDELRTLVQQRDVIHQMVRDVSQLAEFQRVAEDRRIALGTEDEVGRARRQLARDAKLIEALIEGCDVLEAILQSALDRFDAEIKRSGSREPEGGGQ